MPFPIPIEGEPNPFKKCNLCGSTSQQTLTCYHTHAYWLEYQKGNSLADGYPRVTLLDEETMEPLPPPVPDE